MELKQPKDKNKKVNLGEKKTLLLHFRMLHDFKTVIGTESDKRSVLTRQLSAPFLFRTSVRLSHMPLQPSWAVFWFSQEFVTCLIEHLSQIWALWCNILTLSDVRNTRVWNTIFRFWLVSFYLAKCLLNAMLCLFTGILRLLFWKLDFVGNLSKKVIESRYIGQFLIIGQIIVIDFTLP